MNDIIYVPTYKYVYFKEDGNLLSVTNNNKQEGNYIQVDNVDVMNLITGKDQFDHYRVILDTKTKEYTLKHIYSQEEHYYNVNYQIYKIPQDAVNEPDLKIIQDTVNKCWKFKLNSTLRQIMVKYETPMGFSITKAGDPHQLVRYVIVRLSDLIEQETYSVPFMYDYEIDANAFSVYTTKRLETYYYEVIK